MGRGTTGGLASVYQRMNRPTVLRLLLIGAGCMMPEYSEDGVDLTLIRWMLSLTPAERLDFLQKQINRVLAIRELNDRA